MQISLKNICSKLYTNRLIYRTLLAEFEKTCIAEKKFRGTHSNILKSLDAEMAAQRIEELRMQELEYRGYVIEEKNKLEVFNQIV